MPRYGGTRQPSDNGRPIQSVSPALRLPRWAFLEHSISLFRKKLAPRLAHGDHVVELCCGTGHFAQWLARQGYWVTGIDGSRTMLAYARKRLRSDRLFQADIRDFQLRQRVDAIVCFYNSLNQFLEPDSFRAVLASSFRNLNLGGWFLFDFVQEHGYAQFWETDEAFIHGDAMCELRYRFDDLQQLASCTVTIGPFEEPAGVRGRHPQSRNHDAMGAASFEDADASGFRSGAAESH
jgi:SAM-dependent methyltransferase